MRTVKVTSETRGQILEKLLKRSPSQYPEQEKAVREILEQVRTRGDEALFSYTERFDGAKLTRVFTQLLDAGNRRRLFDRQARFDFIRNKADVVRRITALLDDTPAPENA